uniref:Craniofacial development protein 2-like n=1 Tax=Rhabditophanes sp. KR3021 TaxID=114890 RepID=A0AC35UAZ4_9BILA
MEECLDNEINLLDLTEVKQKEVESLTDDTGTIIIAHGVSDNDHAGIGLLIHGKRLELIEAIFGTCYGHAKIRYAKKETWLVGVVYASTEAADEDVKDLFYDELTDYFNALISEESKVTLLLGDFNAEIGVEMDKLHGKHYFGELNSNGCRLRNLCHDFKLFNTSSFFNKRLG